MKSPLVNVATSLCLVGALSAQRPVRVQLVRCTVGSDAPCLRTPAPRTTDRQSTFVLGSDGVAGLARTTAVAAMAVRLDGDASTRRTIDWRPPLIAMPVFQGVADSTTLSTAVREAMVVGMSGGGDRPMIALLLLTMVGCGWLLLARMGWNEPIVVPRERIPGSPPSLVAPPPPAAEPRRPEDITHQTARHTAMHR